MRRAERGEAEQRQLVDRRERAMDAAERALDAAWPERRGDAYVREMEAAARELEAVAEAMRASGVVASEQSRTHRYLGSIYSDLAPERGREWLARALSAYRTAEALLAGDGDDLERARLDFNYGNALRQFDPNDVARLEEAERRFLSARSVFATQAPHHMARTDEALWSVRTLLKLAPLARRVEDELAQAASLRNEVIAETDVPRMLARMEVLKARMEQARGVVNQLLTILDDLPEAMKAGSQYARVRQQVLALRSASVPDDRWLDGLGSQLSEKLRGLIDAEVQAGRTTPERAASLRDLFGRFVEAMERGGNGLVEGMGRLAKMRSLSAAMLDLLRAPSHGIPPPPAGSRAAELVDLCWRLRRFLAEELIRPGKSPGDREAVMDLIERASRVDRRIYEAGGDDAAARNVEREFLRPLALDVRNFSALHHPLLARPIWPTAPVPVATEALFFSGSDRVRELVQTLDGGGWEVMGSSTGEPVASGRWRQIQRSFVTIFDLGVPEGLEQAAVSYELGIALTLGKPVVVLASEGQRLPFDIEVWPVPLAGTREDLARIQTAVDRASVWTMHRPRVSALSATIEEVARLDPGPRAGSDVEQTRKLIAGMASEPDPTALDGALKALVNFLGDAGPVLLHPVWPPVHAERDEKILFHVTPFRPREHFDAVSERVERACTRAGVRYVRGDRVGDPNVIRSIWSEINRASHVLCDLSGFNANVALELGIAHTVGRPVRILVREGTADRLFPMIQHERFHTYRAPDRSLEARVEDFVA